LKVLTSFLCSDNKDWWNGTDALMQLLQEEHSSLLPRGWELTKLSKSTKVGETLPC